MRFRYLVALMAAAGLAFPVQLLAQEASDQSVDSQASVASEAELPASEPDTPMSDASGGEPETMTQGAMGGAESTLGPELEPEQDVEDVLKETERQFDEASRELDQRFREVERESPIEPVSEANDIEDVLAPSSDPDVRAALEETERRFEEASREIEERFKEAERDTPLGKRGMAQPDSNQRQKERANPPGDGGF